MVCVIQVYLSSDRLAGDRNVYKKLAPFHIFHTFFAAYGIQGLATGAMRVHSSYKALSRLF